MTGEWKPIETAPKDGTRVLVVEARPIRRMEIARWIGAPHNHWSIDGYRYISKAAVWMPLPDFPA